MAEFNYVTGQYEGYDAYTSGLSSQVNAPSVSAAQGSDWINNLGTVFGYGVKTYADTWQAKTMMQQSQNGQRFVEGQRIQAIQGGMSPLVLLLIAGVAFMALK